MSVTTVAEQLQRAATILAGLDQDFAQVENGVGYSKSDGSFGHSLASSPPEAWSPEVTRAGWLMLRKYRGQLAARGFDFDEVAEPEASNESRVVRIVDANEAELILRFSYDAELVDAVRRLPGRRWNPTGKVWAADDSPSLRHFIAEYGFQTSASARTILDGGLVEGAPSAPSGLGSVEQNGPRLVLRTSYDAHLVAAIRALPGRRWDSAARVWTTPLTSIRAVREVATTFNLDWHVADLDESAVDSRPLVDVKDGWFTVSFDYDRDLVAALKEIPGAVWDGRRGLWRVPVECAIEVVAFLLSRDIRVSESANTLVREAERAFERISASAATSAELVVPGLRGELLPFQKAGIRYALEALGFVEGVDGWQKS